MEIENKGVEAPAESETAVTESPAVEENQAGSQTPTGSTVENEEKEGGKDHHAFAEMRVKNKQLEEELARYKGQDNMVDEESIALEELRNPRFQGPQNGFTPDMPAEEALNRMSQAERIALEANKKVGAMQTQLENERLYSKFPELNPQHEDHKKPETKAFEQLLAGQWLIARMSGKPVDLVKLAGEVKKVLTGAGQAGAEQATQEAVQNLTRKENATLEAKGNSVTIPRSQNDEERRMRIRRGDQQALQDDLKDSVLKDLVIE